MFKNSVSLARLVSLAAVLGVVVFGASPAAAESWKKTVPFAVDQWIEVGATDGAVTVHRLRLSSGVSEVGRRLRGSDYTEALRLELEFTNDSDTDWKAQLQVVWEDQSGETIQGLDTKVDLDDKSKRAIRKDGVTAFSYGLRKASKLRIDLRFDPD